jgi:prenyl protein peptidase
MGALLRSLFQLTYTTLFGGYATFVFMRTGSLLSVVLLHTFCNWMGLPRFWGRLKSGETILGPDIGESKRSEDRSPKDAGGQLGVAWTIAYYILLMVGAVGWYKLLWPLTESASALAKF